MNSISRSPTVVSIADAKANLSRLLKQVEAGEEVLISRHGKVIAMLSRRADEEEALPRIGALKGKIWIADDFDELGPEWDEYMS